MMSSGCNSQPPKPQRFEVSRRTSTLTGPKSHGPSTKRDDKNMNTVVASSPRRGMKGPPAPSKTRLNVQARAPLGQSRMGPQKLSFTTSKSAKPKPKGGRAPTRPHIAPSPAPPLLPSVLPLDPNCNEPSLPCLCCDGRSPQDSNSMFNHNHNNNNTISMRQQLQLQPPPPPSLKKKDGMLEETPSESHPQAQAQLKEPSVSPIAMPENNVILADDSANLDNEKNLKADEVKKEAEISGVVNVDDEACESDDDDDEDDDDDTLVPSCCDCPPSLLEFSLSSSTSSSSTSISSCSDLDSDSADQSISMGSSHDQDNLSISLSSKDDFFPQALDSPPHAQSPPTLPLSCNPFLVTSHSPIPPCSPDEGYPSALESPSPDYLGVKGDMEDLHPEGTKLDLLDFLESVGEFGKMERFSQVIQVAHWDLEGEQHWDVLRDRLDHLDRLEKVNREVKLAYIARLHEKGLDLEDLEEQDLSDLMDEMGNIDIPWKPCKARGDIIVDSEEFSDAGVDLTAPSDCDDPFMPDSLTPSPMEPPPRPPKPPVRHASVTSDLHTYINISRETTSMAVSTCPTPTLSTFSPNSSSPTFTTFRCEKPLPPSPPSVPPLPVSKPVPYLTLYTTPSPPPSIPTPTPPIPPPRRRHLARKEAQRLAALQAEQEKTPLSLPPPTTRPPPLPPPPVISVSSCSSSPPAIPPPPALAPPPSFHALDVEIRKLLMLAGLTQAELLKLSPELGVCVGGLEDEGYVDNDSPVRSVQPHRFTQSTTDREEVKECQSQVMTKDGWNRSKLDGERRTVLGEAEVCNKKDEMKDPQRTTSFTEMARRRKRNTGPSSDPYYTTSLGNAHESTVKNVSFGAFHYASNVPDSPPPPPPPRPLPPIPSSATPLKVSTLSANSAQPERFDWLIAFTPDCELPLHSPSLEMRKAHVETQKKLSSSDSSSGLGPKVTTFKELRFRNKNASPPTKVITDPDPDPTVITPDPDILYNLKWRREKAGSDGNQWEYTSQAQAFFMQPPPALTSMAALKEMLQRADKEGGYPELCLSQKIGCSVSDSSLWTVGKECDGAEVQQVEKEGKEEEEEVEVRGRADGGWTFESRTTTVRSISFAGSVQSGEEVGGDVKHSVRGAGLSSLCWQEKKALVSAVSVAVEAVLAQFSSSRTVVQKSLSGDSSINPSLGRVVLQCLCPALHNLLSDGRKPHQSDLIAGRRPNSTWALVQASTRPGPKTQALFNLQVRVGELPQLKQSKHRFNAFLLGLLNIKHLDFWLSHLQSCSDVLETHYHPNSFMRLSLSTCQPLFDELLLLLQPLSLLTFNLDLLFQHHHLEADSHSPEIPGPPVQDAGVQQPSRMSLSKSHSSSYLESLSEVDFGSPEHKTAFNSAKYSPSANPVHGLQSPVSNDSPIKASVTLEQTSPQLLWVQEKEIGKLPPPVVEEDSLVQQAGQVIQQGWGAMIHWGGKLSQNLAEFGRAAVQNQKKEETKMNPQEQAGSGSISISSSTQVPWGLGRLFGASKSPTSPIGQTPPTRRPSQWLAPGVTALTRMVSSGSTLMMSAPEPQDKQEPEAETLDLNTKPKPLRSVRMLCDFSGTGSALSFCKGEELVVLSGVDQDWIRCRQGNREGLVPIEYTSLII